MKAPNKEKSDQVKAKKPYRAPRLVVYGDLKSITAARSGARTDGGNPCKAAL